VTTNPNIKSTLPRVSLDHSLLERDDTLSHLLAPERRYVLDFVDRLEQQSMLNDRSLYYLTTTYLDSTAFPLNERTASAHLKKFHRCLLMHLCRTRRLNRFHVLDTQPTLYAFLDVPSSKSKRSKPNSVPQRLSTFHHHSILVAHPRHIPMLNALTDEQAATAFVHDCRARCQLRTIDVQRINRDRSDLIRVVDYCSKYARKRPDNLYALEVYPIAKSEFQ
jgi:hypothetical protein